MKIGNVEIENSLALGPMAGVTDLPFRLLCKEQGCGMLYTEMVSAKAILYKNKNTNILLNIDKAEHPIAVQLFGSDPDIMAEIGAKVAEGPCDFIDINMGCPVKFRHLRLQELRKAAAYQQLPFTEEQGSSITAEKQTGT